MKSLLTAELRKLVTTRSTYFLVAAVAAVALVSVQDPGHNAATFEKPFHEQTFVLFTAILSRVLIVILGIRMATDEFRHGTIVPTFLVTPRRGRVVAAKAVVAAASGALLGLLAWVAITGAAAGLAASEGTSLTVGADAARSLAGMVAGGALWGVIGLGLGTMIRSQIVATVAGLVWLMGVEDAVKGSLGDLGGYLPGQAGLGLATAPDAHVALVAAATMLAYAAFTIVGATVLIKRDVG